MHDDCCAVLSQVLRDDCSLLSINGDNAAFAQLCTTCRSPPKTLHGMHAEATAADTSLEQPWVVVGTFVAPRMSLHVDTWVCVP